MAKGKKATVKVVKVARGGGSIADQIAKLEASMSAADVKEAKSLAADPAKRDILRLAFKLTPKASTRALVLSAREQSERERIAKLLGQNAAEEWEKGVLREKSEKRKRA